MRPQIQLISIDRSSKHKINKETRALYDTLDQLDLIEIYRPFHPKTTEYSFFLSTYGTFSRIDHILGHKSGLNPYRKTEMIPCIFSDHNAFFETGTEPQEKVWEKFKHLEAKDHPTQECLGQPGNQRRT